MRDERVGWRVATGLLWMLAALGFGMAILVAARPPAAWSAMEMAHPDHRFAAGECWTWKGRESVKAWARVFERYDFALTNYPVETQVRFVCQYPGDPDPVSSQPGEYVAPIASNCAMRTVLVNGVPMTSYPVLTAGYSSEYNEGWSYGQTWCKQKPFAYGNPVVTTSTSSMPPPTMPPSGP